MSISDTQLAKKYASIAEVAAAQAKLNALISEGAEGYAEAALASANSASSSANSAAQTVDVVSGLASAASVSALDAANSAASAGSAAADAIGSTVRAPAGEILTELPVANERALNVMVFDGAGDSAVKPIDEFAIIGENGKIPVSVIPSIALTQPFVVSSQEEMLALDVQVGDIAKRTDLGYSFCLSAEPPTSLSNWIQLTDDVLSQLGQSSGASQVGALEASGSPTDVQTALNTLNTSTGNKVAKADLAAADGAKLSLSQVATAYGLDFSLGGVWTAGATSTIDNWWWYNNKVYTGGSGTLPSTPYSPWYPIRPGYELNLTDFITSKGETDILDVVDWQWAFNSAKLNAKHTSIISMEAREYSMTSAGYIAPQGVGLSGPKDAMMNPTLDGVTVIYINKSPSSIDAFITMRGGNAFKNFGIFFAQQTYSTLSSVVDTGIMFNRLPAVGAGDAILTKACILRGVSACGVARLWYSNVADNAAGEYDEIRRVSATPNRFGPTFRYGISTDFLRTKTVHINANVVSAYRARYGVDLTVRALTSSNLSAIGFLIDRMDGGLFEDILTYGVPYAVVLGAVGATGGANAASANFVSCGFDATCFPIYINCPTGAFGVSFSNCQAVYDEQYGDTSGALVYLGAAANAHQIMLSNFKVQKTANFNYRPVRAVAGSLNNRVTISTSALTSSQDSLDEGSGNRFSIVASTRNLGSLNMMTHTTADSSLISSMGELNTIVKQQVVVNVASGSSFTNINVTFPYIGWNSVPNTFTEISAVSITGQSDATLFTARTYSRTSTGCTLRVAYSQAAAASGTVTVDVYLIGTVRGALTAV